jgi:hypothetical protein
MHIVFPRSMKICLKEYVFLFLDFCKGVSVETTWRCQKCIDAWMPETSKLGLAQCSLDGWNYFLVSEASTGPSHIAHDALNCPLPFASSSLVELEC